MAAETKTLTPEDKIQYSFFKDRWPFLALIAVIVIFPLVSGSYFITRLGVVLAINSVLIVGMILLLRYLGLFSIGQSAFLLTGAYVSGILTVHAKGIPLLGNPWIAMIIAALFTVIVAWLFCAPFLKLRAIFLGIATLGLAQIAWIVAKNLDTYTGGVAGLPDIPYLSIFGYSLNKDWQIFYLTGVFLIVFAFIADNVGRTRLGRAYHAIRTNEIAAQAAGINVERNMRDLFCFSALLASISGSLLAHFITFISPESFSPESSLTYMIIALIAGANIWAGLLATILLMGFSEASRGMQDLSTGLYALLLIVTFFAFPDGISAVLFKGGKAARRMAAAHSKRNHSQESIIDIKKTRPEVPDEGNILDISGISMKYGGTEALSKVTFPVGKGQIVGIIGPNGAGKTTLLNTINGYIMPVEGKVTYKGVDVTFKRPHEMAKLGVARTFQLINLFNGMTVIENVMVGGHLKGKAGIFESGLTLARARKEETAIWNTAIKSLETVGILEKAYEIVDSLSFGEQRSVELARALCAEPDLMFVDEPAAGLNTAEAERLGATLRRIRDTGVTIMLVEHNMSLVMSVSDMVAVLEFGKLISFGTPAFVCSDEGVIKAYLGTQEAKSAS
jgi:branched-chain amino acid transport system permease protein